MNYYLLKHLSAYFFWEKIKFFLSKNAFNFNIAYLSYTLVLI